MSKKPPPKCDPSARPLAADSVLGMKVKVHLNLHNGCYVVTVKDQVRGYTLALRLRDVTPRVSASGYQRCRDEHTRNVHAYLDGVLVQAGDGIEAPSPQGWRRITYNCLTGPDCFRFVDTDACLVRASEVIALPGGRVWAAVQAPPARVEGGQLGLLG